MNAIDDIPRIAAVSTEPSGLILVVTWVNGGMDRIDVSPMIGRFRVYAPLRQSRALFDKVRAGEYGTDVCWTDEIDMAADTLWQLAREQASSSDRRDPADHLAVN